MYIVNESAIASAWQYNLNVFLRNIGREKTTNVMMLPTSPIIMTTIVMTLIKKSVLDLSLTKLVSIDPKTFKGLANIEILNLHNNKLTTIVQRVLKGLSRLIRLLLHKNQQTNPPSWQSDNLISGLSNLEDLLLESNKLMSLDMKIFSGLTNLERIEWSSNKLGNRTWFCLIH